MRGEEGGSMIYGLCNWEMELLFIKLEKTTLGEVWPRKLRSSF
jgi:hypothetical protein